MEQSLNKSNSLKSKIVISQIFKEKKGFINYPIRISYIETHLNKPAQLVFSVPKRKFKRAVDRNKIKRLIREAYRTNQSDFITNLTNKKKSLAIYIGFVGNEMPSYSVIEEKIKLSLVRLLNELDS